MLVECMVIFTKYKEQPQRPCSLLAHIYQLKLGMENADFTPQSSFPVERGVRQTVRGPALHLGQESATCSSEIFSILFLHCGFLDLMIICVNRFVSFFFVL